MQRWSLAAYLFVQAILGGCASFPPSTEKLLSPVELPLVTSPVPERAEAFKRFKVEFDPAGGGFYANGIRYRPDQYFPYVNSFPGISIKKRDFGTFRAVGVGALAAAGAVALAAGIKRDTDTPRGTHDVMNGGDIATVTFEVTGVVSLLGAGVLGWLGLPPSGKSYCNAFNAKLQRTLRLRRHEIRKVRSSSPAGLIVE